MYNKIFTKILDSSIWLEPMATRIVWLTFIAAMDEDGFVAFACVQNVAHRARVTEDEAQAAIACLESPDPNSSDPENDGRRVERVPGGWMVINATKYREMVTRTVAKERTRERVKRFRARQGVTPCNADVTPANVRVTQSEAVAVADTEAKAVAKNTLSLADARFGEFWAAYPKRVSKGAAEKAFAKALKETTLENILAALAKLKPSYGWTKDGGQFVPHPSTWLNAKGWNDEPQDAPTAKPRNADSNQLQEKINVPSL